MKPFSSPSAPDFAVIMVLIKRTIDVGWHRKKYTIIDKRSINFRHYTYVLVYTFLRSVNKTRNVRLYGEWRVASRLIHLKRINGIEYFFAHDLSFRFSRAKNIKLQRKLAEKRKHIGGNLNHVLYYKRVYIFFRYL